VFKNKQGEDGEVVRNKAHLVAQGYSQVDGQDFGETFAPIARLEAIRILLAFAASKGFKLYQIDMKSVFLYGVIQEEVLLSNPQVLRTLSTLVVCISFQRLCTDLKKHWGLDMLGLKSFLLEHGYVMGSVDKTLFTPKHGNDFLLVQIYVDDIIFSGSSHSLVSSFQAMMENEFQMSIKEWNTLKCDTTSWDIMWKWEISRWDTLIQTDSCLIFSPNPLMLLALMLCGGKLVFAILMA
jgi:hypothetical protein